MYTYVSEILSTHPTQLRNKERLCYSTCLFTCIAIACWLVAGYFFFFHPQTNWIETAAESRTLNSQCVVLDFYDFHDLWHFLSAVALFMSFLVRPFLIVRNLMQVNCVPILQVLLTLDDDLVACPRDKIRVF